MQKTEKVTIDGDYYELQQLGAVQGLGLFHEIRKLAMPFLRELVTDPKVVAAFGRGDAATEAALEADTNLQGKLAGLVFTLFESLDRDLELELAAAFAGHCRVKIGEALISLGDARQPASVFDQHFAGRYMSYQKWLLACARLNFASFLGSSAASTSPSGPATP